MTEPCKKCDFIGPFPENFQQHHEFHRAWHQVTNALRPLIEAFRALGEAAAEARAQPKDAYTLAGPSKGDSK